MKIILKQIKVTLTVCLLAFAYTVKAEQGKKATEAYQELTTEDLIKYRSELTPDPNKSFDSEFVRKTDLENHLIRQHGFSAVKLLFEGRNSDNYHLLGLFPEGSPWFYLNNKSMSEAIDAIFEPIQNKAPNLIVAMKERIRLIYVEQQGADWVLHYLLDIKLYDGRDYYRIYSGGAPNPSPTRNKNLVNFNWSIPNDLKTFYTIHDGFGEMYDAHFILNSAQIKVMAEMMNPILEEQKIKPPQGYSFNDLLEFFPDGSGNAQCFIKTAQGNNATVDWDHEVWEISEPENFYEFIDARMSMLDEE